ncbi:MAG: class I SAM-dependent methyltransferase [Bacteriovoracaceae bacterium]
MSSSKNYWTDEKFNNRKSGRGCPNVSMFRFLGSNGVIRPNIKVLEVGFGGNFGADLIEFQKRSATAKGVDLNKGFVDSFREENPEIEVAVMDIGVDAYPFTDMFNLIFSRDTIYYLTDAEILYHLKSSFDKIEQGGHFLCQIVEKDIAIPSLESSAPQSTDFNRFLAATISPIFPKENPVRFLNVDSLIKAATETGFKLVGCKTLIESFDLKETAFRVNRYFLFSK